jgi:hypothetical protein
METSGSESFITPRITPDNIYVQDILAKTPENHGTMFVPVILGSDKTTVSVATGQNDYWPFYGSLGNLHNDARRAHGAGLALIAFLAIPKGTGLLISYP